MCIPFTTKQFIVLIALILIFYKDSKNFLTAICSLPPIHSLKELLLLFISVYSWQIHSIYPCFLLFLCEQNGLITGGIFWKMIGFFGKKESFWKGFESIC